MLEIETNIPDVVLEFDRLRTQQVPFATALALNDLAAGARDEQTRGIFARFTVRRPARLSKSVVVSRYAKKTELRSIVTVRDTFLVQHEDGEVRRPGDVFGSIAQPQRGREKRIGVLRGKNSPRGVLESSRRAFIARTASGKVGVFERRGVKRYPIDLVFSFERQSRLPRLLKAGATVEGFAVRAWNDLFGRALAKAMASSR